MTKFQLFSLLASPKPEYATISGKRGIVLAVQREDGSGKCFNVLILNLSGVQESVFVRTID